MFNASLGDKVRVRDETLESALDDLADALREVVDVVCVQTSHGDTAVSGHVYMRLLGQSLGLRLSQTGETRDNSERCIAVLLRKDPYLNMPIWLLM